MGEVGIHTEAWRRRGLLPSLLLAIQAQTRLLIPGADTANQDDLASSLRWLPLVGVALGGLWSLSLAFLLTLGLSSFVSATFLAALMVLGGGILWERGLSESLAGILSPWHADSEQRLDSQDRLSLSIAVICLAIVLRVACLTEVSSEHYVSTLIAAAVLSRWAVSLSALAGSEGEGAWPTYLFIAGAVAIVMALCLGGLGLIFMALTGATMALMSRVQGDATLEQRMRGAAVLALCVELSVFLS